MSNCQFWKIQNSRDPKLGKSKFGNDKFGARVPLPKPENINQILENVFEGQANKQRTKPKIVNRPQNSNKPGRPSNQPSLGQSLNNESPLVGYKNTGGKS